MISKDRPQTDPEVIFKNAEQLRSQIEELLAGLTPPDEDRPEVGLERTERELVFSASCPWAKDASLDVFVRGDNLVAEKAAGGGTTGGGTFVSMSGRANRAALALPAWVDRSRATAELSGDDLLIVFPRKQFVMPGGTRLR